VSYTDVDRDALTKQEVTIKNFLKEEKEEERWINARRCGNIVHNSGENKHEHKEQTTKGRQRLRQMNCEKSNGIEYKHRLCRMNRCTKR